MPNTKHSNPRRLLHRQRSSLSSVDLSALLVLWGAAAGTCHAADGTSDCSAVYEAGVEQERAGRLQDALLMFRDCAADGCKDPGRTACQAKLFRLELDTPSVVPLIMDAAGAPIVDAEVTMDGIALASRLDGRAFPVDPGLHDFAFMVAGEPVGNQRRLIAQGQRNRELSLTLGPPVVDTKAGPSDSGVEAQPVAASATPDVSGETAPSAADVASSSFVPSAGPAADQVGGGARSGGGSVAPYLLGGGALLGAGAYLALSSWARSDNQKLSQCSPNCSPESVQHIRSLYLAANVSLGVAAAAALGAVGWLVFSSAGSGSDDEPPPRGLAFALQPERAGALGTVRGTL